MASPGGRTWPAVGVALSASFLVMLDTTMVNVALPQMAVDLDTSDGIEWVVTAYLLALGVAQPITGWLADRFGMRESFLAGLVAFALASGAVAAAPTLPLVVAARVVQGLAGGVIVPLVTALIFDIVPPDRRGAAVGTAGTAVMVAPTIGPVLAGYVVTTSSWRWLLLIHVPIGLVAAVVGLRVIPKVETGVKRSLDVLGLGLVSVGLIALLVASSEVSSWGIGSARFILVFGLGAMLLAWFVVRSLRLPEPLVELRVFRSRTFTLCMGIVVALSMPQFARNVFIPVELQTVRGLSALEAGLVLAPAAVLGAMMMAIGGRWTDRRGGREPIALGLLLLAVTTGGLALTDLSAPIWQVATLVAVSGLGTVLVSMPSTVVSLSAVASHLVAHGSAMRSLVRQVSASLSTAVLATVIVAQAGVLAPRDASAAVLEAVSRAYRLGYLLAAIVAAAGLVLVAALPRAAGSTAAATADVGTDDDDDGVDLQPESVGLTSTPGDAAL